MRVGSEHAEQFGNDGRFVLCVAAGPGARLQFQKVADVRLGQSIQMHVELNAVERYEPSPPVFDDVALADRLKYSR